MGYIGKVPADVLIDPHVDSAAITDGTIITADIADDAVTSAKLAQNSVDSSELIDGSVDNSHLAGSIAVNKTLLSAGTGLTLSTNTLNVDAAQSQITSVGTLSSLTVTGDINFDSNTLFVDASENRVGVGLNNPAKLFHVEGSTPNDFLARIKNTHSTGEGLQIHNNNTSSLFRALDVRNSNGQIFQIYNDGAIVIKGDGSDQTTKWHSGSAYVNAKLDVRQLAIAFSGSDKVTSNTSGNFTFNETLTIGTQQGGKELMTNRARMRHIDGVADANASFSHGDLYVNHISTGNIYMQRATTFASTVQVNDNDLTVKMNNHASGIRVNVDRKDTNDYGGFEIRTGGSQRWFVGMRELGNDDLQFFNGNSSSGSYQNVLSLNHSNANATFAEGVAINGASIGSHKLVVDNGTTSFNRGNSSGNILELRGQNSSQVVFAAGETTYGTSSVNNNVRVHGNLRMNAANSVSFQNASGNETVSLYNGGASNETVLYSSGGIELTGTTNSATSGKGRGQINASGHIGLNASTTWKTVRTLYGGYQSGILVFHVSDSGNAANTRCQIYAFNADYYERGVSSIDNVTAGVAPGGIEVQIVRDDGSTTSDGGGPYHVQARPANGTSALTVRLLILSAGD